MMELINIRILVFPSAGEEDVMTQQGLDNFRKEGKISTTSG